MLVGDLRLRCFDGVDCLRKLGPLLGIQPPQAGIERIRRITGHDNGGRGATGQAGDAPEALIASMQGLLAIQTDIRDMIAELSAWLRQPASTDLPDLIRALITSTNMLRTDIEALPAAVARAVVDTTD